MAIINEDGNIVEIGGYSRSNKEAIDIQLDNLFGIQQGTTIDDMKKVTWSVILDEMRDQIVNEDHRFISDTQLEKLSNIEEGAQVNIDTNLLLGLEDNILTLESSTGNSVVIPIATSTTAGLMTHENKTKIDTIESNAEVNQNAFSKIASTGQTAIESAEKIDTINLESNSEFITIATDNITKTITFDFEANIYNVKDGLILDNLDISLGLPTKINTNSINEVTLESHSHSIETTTSGQASTIIATDENGNFSANEITAALKGNSDSSTKLETSREISITGDANGQVSFDGSSDVEISTTIVDYSHQHNISNVDGLQDALDLKADITYTKTEIDEIEERLQIDIDSNAQEIIDRTVNYSTIEVEAIEDQTIFNLDYTIGYVDVFRNGVKLSNSEFTADDGASVILLDPCNESDIIAFKSLNTNFLVVDTYTQGTTDGLLESKADKSTTYIKTEIDEKENSLQDSININTATITNEVIRATNAENLLSNEITDLRILKVDISSVYTKIDIDQIESGLQDDININAASIANEETRAISVEDAIYDEIATLNAIKVDQDDIYTKIEIDTITETLENSLANDISINTDNISTNTGDIAGIEANKADKVEIYTKIEIDALESELQEDIDTNTSNITTNTENIATLDTNKADQITTYTKEETDLLRKNLSAGTVSFPSYTNNGDGSVTIGIGEYRLFSTDYFMGNINKYAVAGSTFTLIDKAINYIVVDYNNGTPILKNITDRDTINESNILQIYTLSRQGTDISKLEWNEMGRGLPNKLHQRLGYVDRLKIESGLAISETGTRNIICDAGYVWNVTKRNQLSAVDTTVDSIKFFYHVGGEWTSSVVNQYDNLQYDDGTDLQTLLPNRYAVNWVYRPVDEDNQTLDVFLGTGNYTLEEAENANPPVVPDYVSLMSVLIGKIIVEKGEDNATILDRVSTTSFSTSPITDHKLLANIGTLSHDELETAINVNTADITNNTQEIIDRTVNYSTAEYVSIENQTVFNITYTVGYVDVFINGVKLSSSEYTADDGTSVILNNPSDVNDIVSIKALNTNFLVVDTYTQNTVNGLLETKADKAQEDWITPTLLNGWTGKIKYRKNQFGDIDVYVNLLGTGTSGSTVFEFEEGYYPPENTRALIASDNVLSTAILTININGEVEGLKQNTTDTMMGSFTIFTEV